MRTTSKIIMLLGAAASSQAAFQATDLSIERHNQIAMAQAESESESCQVFTDSADYSDCCCCGGCCGCCWSYEAPAYWWSDTWYSWGDDWYYSDNAYWAYYDLYYCSNSGVLYEYDPAAWGYYPGWTMVAVGFCGDQGDDWWVDTWYSWGSDWYYQDTAYWVDDALFYCASSGTLYVYDASIWGWYPGWTMASTWQSCDPANVGYGPVQGDDWWVDTWYSWGDDWYYTDGAYWAYDELYYCAANGNLYIYDPAAWGWYPGWTMDWAGTCEASADYVSGYDTSDCCGCGCGCGCCGCCCWSYEAPAYWWSDTWYSWGDDWYYSDNAYWAYYDLYYCADAGVLYLYDPSAWGYYPGWTMVAVGFCGEQGDDWWVDTWYSWGYYWYYQDTAYWFEDDLFYCAANGSLYIYDASIWGWYPGWTMAWAGSCDPANVGYGPIQGDDWWVDTWYSWGDDWYYSDSAYWANDELYYCASSGTLYIYDPAAWGFYPGWTMNWAGSC